MKAEVLLFGGARLHVLAHEAHEVANLLVGQGKFEGRHAPSAVADLREEAFVRVGHGAAFAQSGDAQRAGLLTLTVLAVARGAVALEERARRVVVLRRSFVARRTCRRRQSNGGERELESFRGTHLWSVGFFLLLVLLSMCLIINETFV